MSIKIDSYSIVIDTLRGLITFTMEHKDLYIMVGGMHYLLSLPELAALIAALQAMHDKMAD